MEKDEITEKIITRTVNACGVETEYFCFGEGEKSLVVIPGLSVRGVTEQADAIARAYRELAEAFSVYVFDRRRDMPDVYTLDDMAKDTAEAIRAAGLGRVFVFGASQGGMIAVKIAADFPELVEKLAVGSSAARITRERFRTVERWIKLAEKKDAEKLYLDFGEAIYPKEVFEKAREFLTESAKEAGEHDLRRFIIAARALKDADVTRELGRISCPVFSIGDTDDRVLGAKAAEEIGTYVGAGCRFESYMYRGFGHASYDTAPDYKRRLLRFFASEGDARNTER